MRAQAFFLEVLKFNLMKGLVSPPLTGHQLIGLVCALRMCVQQLLLMSFFLHTLFSLKY